MQTGFNFIYEKLFDDATKTSPKLSSFFPVTKGAEIFYTVKDGNWSDLNVWETVSGRVNKLPAASDNIYIKHRVLTNLSSVTVNDMYIASTGTLRYDDQVAVRTVNVLGNLTSYGIINGISSTGFGLLLKLYGKDTVIKQYLYSGDTAGGIEYAGNSDQYIAPIQYRNFYLSGSGKKYLTGNLTVDYKTDLGGTGTLELLGYDFTSGTQGVNMSCSLSKMYTSGKVLFRSTLNLSNGGANTLDFSAGNPDVECWNGITHSNGFNGAVRFKSGTGTWRFTTNNQSILDSNANGVLPFMGNIYVDNGLTLTIGGGSGTYITTILYGQTIAGNSLSKVIMKDRIYFATSTAADNFMVGALTDFSTFNWTQNRVGYIFNGNYSISYNTFGGLYITGTGTKSLTSNTTLAGVLDMNTNGINGNPTVFQLSSYNFSVTSTTTIAPYNSLLKSGAGNVTFIGNVSFQNAPAYKSILDFSGGNPNVELRGGISVIGGVPPEQFKTGTGTWTFSTNNQSISGGLPDWTFDSPIVITGGITLSLINVGADIRIRLNNTITGVSGTDKFLLGNGSATYRSIVRFNTTSTTMSTGIFDFTTNQDSCIEYAYNGDYSIPYSTYQHLTIGGSGTKTASSNLQINQNLVIEKVTGVSSNFELSTYNLTLEKKLIMGSGGVWGSSEVKSSFKKSAAGSILFKGKVDLISGSVDFNLSGNPSVELRGGLSFNSYSWQDFYSGTGTWTFSTNNQDISSGQTIRTFDCSILISGAILLTHTFSSGTFSEFIFNGIIDGNNANSVFVSNTIARYRSATAPMITGKLYANQNTANIFYYDAGGNQDIKVPDDPTTPGYRHLTLAGSGAKRLLGNVSVKGTYTLTAPATLDNNGFSLTNP